MIDAETLRSLLDYDPATGVFTWRVATSYRIKIGDNAGWGNSEGYQYITILKRKYGAHRLAWVYVYGDWPLPHLCVDHINNIRTDNRICNLRLATYSQNNVNRPNHKGDMPRGVHRYNNKFVAKIKIKGKTTRLGSYVTAEEAHAAYCEAAQKEFGAYYRAG